MFGTLDGTIQFIKVSIVALALSVITGLGFGVHQHFAHRAELRVLADEVRRLQKQRAIDDTVVTNRVAETPKLKAKEKVIRETIRVDSPREAEPVPDSVLDSLGM